MRQSTPADRLTGWASIGGYIGRDARTAQRYERDRGLPVRRMPGEGRSTVFALRAELDRWLLQQGEAAATEGSPPPADTMSSGSVAEAPAAVEPRAVRPQARRAPVWTAVSALTLLFAGALFLGFALRRGAPAAAASPSLLYDQQGAAAWSERTPNSLARAIDDYTQAVVRNPADASAYAGLANSYNLAPELTGMAPADAYPRAEAAARRSLALSPDSAGAHRALAFALFWWGQDVRGAEAEFRRALALEPSSALTRHWYANVLGARGDPHAVEEIDRAIALDPSPASLIDKGWILSILGRQDEAETLLRAATRLQPNSAPAHLQLALALRRRGDTAGELRELHTVADLQHDDGEAAVLAEAERTLQTGGRMSYLHTIAARQAALLADGRGSAFRAAVAAADLHRREDTLRFLAEAKLAHDPAMMVVRANPDFAWLHGDPRFERLAP